MKKRINISLIMIVAVLTLLHVCCLAQEVETGEATDIQQFKRGIFLGSVGAELSNRNSAERAVDNIRNAQFNVVFQKVRSEGEVYYSSMLDPRAARIESTFADPLRFFINQCHSVVEEDNVGVVAWISVFPAYSGKIDSTPPPGSIAQQHPDWLSRDINGDAMDNENMYWLDPGHPEVHGHILKIVLEIVTNYDVDGILLDDFRYPDIGINWGYNPGSLDLFRRQTGILDNPLPHDPRWVEWRRKQVTSLMEKIYRAVKSVKPSVNIYVGGIAWGKAPDDMAGFSKSRAYSLVMQDWAGWLDRNLLDGVVIHNYKQYPQQENEFISWLEFSVNNLPKKKVISGIGGFFNFNSSILNQIRMVREMGLGGVALYSYAVSTQGSRESLFGALPGSVFSSQLINVRRSGINFEGVGTPTAFPLEEETSPSLKATYFRDEFTTQPEITLTPTPTPLPVVMPSVPGLPALPDLASMLTPTPVVTPAPEIPSPEIQTPVPDTRRSPRVRETPIQLRSEQTPEPEPTMEISLPEWDTFYLKNGSIIKGKILEEVEGKVSIETSKGFIITLPIENIEKRVKYE